MLNGGTWLEGEALPKKAIESSIFRVATDASTVPLVTPSLWKKAFYTLALPAGATFSLELTAGMKCSLGCLEIRVSRRAMLYALATYVGEVFGSGCVSRWCETAGHRRHWTSPHRGSVQNLHPLLKGASMRRSAHINPLSATNRQQLVPSAARKY